MYIYKTCILFFAACVFFLECQPEDAEYREAPELVGKTLWVPTGEIQYKWPLKSENHRKRWDISL